MWCPHTRTHTYAQKNPRVNEWSFVPTVNVCGQDSLQNWRLIQCLCDEKLLLLLLFSLWSRPMTVVCVYVLAKSPRLLFYLLIVGLEWDPQAEWPQIRWCATEKPCAFTNMLLLNSLYPLLVWLSRTFSIFTSTLLLAHKKPSMCWIFLGEHC